MPQNVLYAFNFDMMFTYIFINWEDNVNDFVGCVSKVPHWFFFF